MKHARQPLHRSEFLSREGHCLAVAECRHRQAGFRRVWDRFRLILCAVALAGSLLWLYACAYL
jgi:hypothetical protein